MDIAAAEDPLQLDIAAVSPLHQIPDTQDSSQINIVAVSPISSTQIEDPLRFPSKMDIAAAEDPLQLDIAAASPLHQIPDTNMDLNVDTTTVEEFDNRPLKRPKCSESSIMDDSLPSPLISTSSQISKSFESITSESDNQINDESLPSSPSPTKSTLSPFSKSVDEETISEDDNKQPDKYNNMINNVTYDYLPQDYTLTELDECAHSVIEDASEKELLVKIDDIHVHQRELVCLLDHSKWLDDDVLGAYICCIKDQNTNCKMYFENPFYTGLLKRDGDIGIHGATYMTEIVRNYLKHNMIYLPINIKNSHWYLAIINIEKTEIQVLDSLCWEFNRADLTTTLQGLQYHLDILKSQKNMISDNWKDIDLTKWTITEQLHTPIQKDSSSCGLFVLKFMEYWTGYILIHPITQEIITSFQYKLAAILLCWKTNTAPATTMIEESDHQRQENPSDVIMSDIPFDQLQSEELNSLSIENKYQSLMSVLSNLSLQELVGGLCNYIKSINSVETLEKVWVKSSIPYPISLTLKKLQEILNEKLAMDGDCFNLVVRKIVSDDIQIIKKSRGLISKHYLDMRFWMVTDFGRHPDFRKKLDVEKLAHSVSSWPGMKYSVASCKTIHIPIKQSGSDFILFTLDKDTRTVYILDPTPVEPKYQLNPHAKYVHRLLWIAEHLPKAMSKACPGSIWNENIFLWQQKIVPDISGQKRELSGYLVTLFMSTWKDERLQLPFLKDGYELRKQNLVQLLTFKENECEDNIPSGVLDFINCIKKKLNNMKVKK